MKTNEQGLGIMTEIGVGGPKDGPRFRVTGRDVVDGHWAAFIVELGWTEWDAIKATVERHREEVAQGRIC